MDIIKQFGNTIRSLRKEKGLTQENLGELADLHYSYIGGIERGERNISLSNIYKVCQALDLSISEVFLKIESPYFVKEDQPTNFSNISLSDQEFFKELINLLQTWKRDI